MPAKVNIQDSIENRFKAFLDAVIWKNPEAAANAIEKKLSKKYDEHYRHYKEFGDNVKVLGKTQASQLRISIKKQYIVENINEVKRSLSALFRYMEVHLAELDVLEEKRGDSWTDAMRDEHDHRRSLTQSTKDATESMLSTLDAAEREGKNITNLAGDVLDVIGRISLYVAMRKRQRKAKERDDSAKKEFNREEIRKRQQEITGNILEKIREMQKDAAKRIKKVHRGVGFFMRKRMPILVVQTSSYVLPGKRDKVLNNLRLWGAARFVYPITGNFIFTNQTVFFLEKDYANKRKIDPEKDLEEIKHLADLDPDKDILLVQRRSKNEKRITPVDGTYRYWVLRKRQKEQIEKNLGRVLVWEILEEK